MIHVEDERVWEAYVKVNPDARPFRTKVIDNWEDLVIICGQDHANGEGAETGAEGYESSFESEANILEESSPIDEGLTNRGNVPKPAWEIRNKGTRTSGRPIRK